MTDEINNAQDIIDSRDVIKRIAELEEEINDALHTQDIEDLDDEIEALTDEATGLREGATERTAEITAELASLRAKRVILVAEANTANITWEQEELDALKALEAEAEDYTSEWRDGATLIRDTYFEEYAEELVKEIGDLPRDLPSYLVIDWSETADNLKSDYTKVSFDGVDYWIR